jgi:hypothetical protein
LKKWAICPNSQNFADLKKHLAEQLQALEALRSDPSLKREIEFETKLQGLLAHYGKSL